MYSSEYDSSYSEPAASHLAAPPSPRHEGKVGQVPSNMVLRKANMEKEDLADGAGKIPSGWAVSEKKQDNSAFWS
jgi:hypothetical protein